MTGSTRAHPDTEPAPFRPVGLGPEIPPAVRRPRTDDPGALRSSSWPNRRSMGKSRGRWPDVSSRSSAVSRIALAPDGRRLGPARIRVLTAPPEHVGLGVGTQLSLAVAECLHLRLAGRRTRVSKSWPGSTGRGSRSGIGLHGFQLGGFIVDGGRKNGTGIPPLVARHAFPEEWSILVVQPPGMHGLHGADEVRAFAGLPPIAERVTERLCRIVLLDLIPAVVERDLATFGAALAEFQAQVGGIFAPAQGGIYRSRTPTRSSTSSHEPGFVGIGQSSWGPTLYGFSDQPVRRGRLWSASFASDFDDRWLNARSPRRPTRGASSMVGL